MAAFGTNFVHGVFFLSVRLSFILIECDVVLCCWEDKRRGEKKFELWVLRTLAAAFLNSASKIPSARFSIIAIRSAVIIFVAILKASCDAHFRAMLLV